MPVPRLWFCFEQSFKCNVDHSLERGPGPPPPCLAPIRPCVRHRYHYICPCISRSISPYLPLHALQSMAKLPMGLCHLYQAACTDNFCSACNYDSIWTSTHLVVNMQAKGNRGAGGSAAKKASKGGNPVGNPLTKLSTGVPQVSTPAPKKAVKAANKTANKASKTANKAASKVRRATSSPAASTSGTVLHRMFLGLFASTALGLTCCSERFWAFSAPPEPQQLEWLR